MRFSLTKTLLAGCLFTGAGAAQADVTGSTGAGVGYGNMQPSMVMGQYVQTAGYYPSRSATSGATFGLVGQVRTFAYSSAPFFVGEAIGQLLPINQEQALFSVMLNAFGGDGQNSFALPNLIGTTMVGSSSSFAIAQQTGSNVNILTMAQMAAHEHDSPGVDTGSAGGGQAINNYQSSVGMTYAIVEQGAVGRVPGQGQGAIGQVIAFTGDYTPAGLLRADGRLLTIADHADLFGVLGTTYGGDGLTTFALPNLNNRAVVGTSAFGDATHLEIGLGGTTGVACTTLTEQTMPAHSHTLPDGSTSASEGGGQSFSNVQPSIGLNYLIALDRNFPVRGDPMRSDPLTGEIIAYAGNLAQLPANYALANGQLLPIRQYQALFSLIGTTYGGDGQNFFALPDLRGRTIVGEGIGRSSNVGVDVRYTVGQILGSASVGLTDANLPAHVHGVTIAPTAAVPEPATWGLMIAGFGVMGLAMRRRDKVRTVVSFA